MTMRGPSPEIHQGSAGRACRPSDDSAERATSVAYPAPPLLGPAGRLCGRDFLEIGREMAQERRPPRDAEAAQLGALPVDLDHAPGDVGELRLRVDAPRNGEPDELE